VLGRGLCYVSQPKLRQRDLLAVKAATSERVTFYVGASSILSTFVLAVFST
jgi:hypothetical protein